MALRTGHGNGAGVPRIEVLPPDEALKPVPCPEPSAAMAALLETASAPGPIPKGAKGHPVAVARARLGGLAKARKVRLVDSLGIAAIAADSTFAPYRTAAEEFVGAHLAELALVAGGKVGTGPSTMVASAALQLAASRWAFDRAAQLGDADLMKLGSTLANDSRQNLAAANEYAKRDGKAMQEQGAAATAAMQAEDERDEAAMQAKRARERAALEAQGEDLGDEEAPS